jgi:GntR family transcriptional regulator, transcriptional repressor for pyruvate dehydrogenase complex
VTSSLADYDAQEAAPAARPSLTDGLMNQILQIISRENLSTGDGLPTVRELAKRFSVTAPTVREALRGLQATGAVELRHGSGIYVGAGVSRMVLANPHVTAISTEATLQLVDARLMIEPAIAAQAALHRTPASLDRLRAALATALQPRGADQPQVRMNFHRELAAASGNTVIYEVIDSLLSVHRREQQEVRRVYDHHADYDQHVAIFEAVSDQDAERAGELTSLHLTQIRNAVAARNDLTEPHG